MESDFEGFPEPEKEGKYTRMPNAVVEEMADLSHAELRVLIYLIRYTFGMNSFDNWTDYWKLTLRDFMEGFTFSEKGKLDSGTGLSKTSVRSALRSLEAKGFIETRVDDTDRGRIKKYYRPRLSEPAA